VATNSEAARLRNLERARQRVESGEAFWVWRFRIWLGPKLREHGEELMAEWAGVHPRQLKAYLGRDRLTVPVDMVDRLLIWEGSTRLDELYPLGDEDS
jgi:hypothetical protein